MTYGVAQALLMVWSKAPYHLMEFKLMRHAVTARLALAAVGLFVLGCSPEASTAPLTSASAPAPAALLGLPTAPLLSSGSTVSVPVVRRTQALASDITTTKTIGALGGVIAIPEAGLVVTFLPGAVLANTPIVVTAYAGSFVSYGFGPHIDHFLAPVIVTQNMSMTTSNDPSATLYGAFTPNGQADLSSDGSAVVSELLGVRLLQAPLLGQLPILTASFVVQHFSGYILASGRQ